MAPKIETPTLRTGRLTLKPYTPGDEDAFVELFTDSDVTRWMGMPATDVRAMFRRGFTGEISIDWDVWAVWEGTRLVGHAELKPSPQRRVDGYELVYALTPRAWGRGLGAEIAQAVGEHGFGTLGLTEVFATVEPANERSLKLLRGLGYVELPDIEDEDEPRKLLVLKRPASDQA